MGFDYSNKKILITGASSGIGAYTAYEASKNGANLILIARRMEKLKKVKLQCKQLGAKSVEIYSVDLSQSDAIDIFVSQLSEADIQIDVLINNAGFGHSELFLNTDYEQVSALFKVNVFGLMYLTQQVAIKMLDQAEGHIINIASLAGYVSTPHYAIYGATKGAVISFSNALRMELKPHNIHVTVVNFGPVDTPFFSQIEGNRKEKVDKSPLTLSAEQSGYIINQVIGTKKREVNRPFLLNLGSKLYPFVPDLVDYILIKYYNE